MLKCIRNFAAFFCWLTIVTTPAFAADKDIMVVFDASGSMWGEVDGTAKIDIARDAFVALSKDWQQRGQSAGLVAYGHRRKGDCADIEVISEPSQSAATAMSADVAKLTPRGKTPLSDAVRQAAEVLKFRENKATVILLSDGVETCNLDPCAVGQDLENLGIDFTAHVIGFDIQNTADKEQLECLADATGGQYFDAKNAGDLSTALGELTQTETVHTGDTQAHFHLKLAPGTNRPAQVHLTAENTKTGAVLDLGTLTGADQVLNGLRVTLPIGTWSVTAKGDAGMGSLLVILDQPSGDYHIPFLANKGDFEYIGDTEFQVGGLIEYQLRSHVKLQENAEYTLWLFPADPKSFDENLTYQTRFGSDPEITDHQFYAGELGLKPGAYEIIILTEYDLPQALARFPIRIVAEQSTQATPITAPLRIVATYSDGSLPVGPASWEFKREGDADLSAPTSDGPRAMFEGFLIGRYQAAVTLQTANGPVEGVGAFEVTEDQTDEIILILDKPVPAATKASPTAQPTSSPRIDIWKTCHQKTACAFDDPRINLRWKTPSGWANSEPFYYTTAGGAEAKHPSMEWERQTATPYLVALNPRQWGADLGPCETTNFGQLCREASDKVEDIYAYAGIKASLSTASPLPAARSWTAVDMTSQNLIALLKIDTYTQNAPSTALRITLPDPEPFGITGQGQGQAQFSWDGAGALMGLQADVPMGDETLSFLISRPGDWDGKSNIWSGLVVNTTTGKAFKINLF